MIKKVVLSEIADETRWENRHTYLNFACRNTRFEQVLGVRLEGFLSQLATVEILLWKTDRCLCVLDDHRGAVHIAACSGIRPAQ